MDRREAANAAAFLAWTRREGGEDRAEWVITRGEARALLGLVAEENRRGGQQRPEDGQ